jgi:hypothetical protein
VETNKDSAVQIEIVGFAHRPKSQKTLRNVARLCRWIESTHGVPKAWPNGRPKPAVNGGDPGGHNRNAANWDARGGHYGHSNVPENTHWDPGYTQAEADFILAFDPEAIGNTEAATSQMLPQNPETDPRLAEDRSHMPDHSEVEGEGALESAPFESRPESAVQPDPAMIALEAKIEARTQLPADTEVLQRDLSSLEGAEAAIRGMESFSVGHLEALENIRLRWVKPNWFEFIPRSSNPFRFVRASGQVIEPRRMFTDGGSIPRLLRWGSELDPWGFAPAFLLHDYAFDLHHCERSDASFEDVRDMMMEAVRTLMSTGICPTSSIVFGMIYLGIDSIIARRLWNARPTSCPLPPDTSER